MFRVDNPHTKPFKFWQWLIAEVHKVNKDIIFLAEAFTRRENETLQWTHHIEFCAIENPQILAYFKQSEDGKTTCLLL